MSARSSFKFIAALSLVTGSIASAASFDTVGLSGTVDSNLFVDAGTPVNGAMDLPMDNTEHIVLVANITSGTNNYGGLTLTATSGSLVEGLGNGAPIPYAVWSVAAATSAPLAADFVNAGDDVTGSTAAGAWNRDLYIKYTPDAAPIAGTYTDTIDLTVADN